MVKCNFTLSASNRKPLNSNKVKYINYIYDMYPS